MDNNAIKKENRKALPKYLLTLLIAGLIGGILGVTSIFFAVHGTADAVAVGLNRFLAAITPWGIPVSTAIFLGISQSLYLAAKKLFAAWDGEDEAAASEIDQKLNWVLLLETITIALNFFFFSSAVLYLSPLHMIITVGVFLLATILYILQQQRVVDLTRRMNPEKQGSIYDLNFQKKWLSSCDEAEQRQIGQAAYKAFRVTGIACIILWGTLVFLSFMLDISLLPSFLVLLIWVILNAVYSLECMRLSKPPAP